MPDYQAAAAIGAAAAKVDTADIVMPPASPIPRTTDSSSMYGGVGGMGAAGVDAQRVHTLHQALPALGVLFLVGGTPWGGGPASGRGGHGSVTSR